MGIFDLFKKLFKEDGAGVSQKQEVIIEKLAFSEIENWIGGKIKENEVKEKEVFFVVKEKIENFIKDIREKIVILRGFDVGAKKEEERIKNIVIDSRGKYIESVEDLIERLNNLEEFKLEKFIERINRIFFDFNKSSFNNYERATILIGKEMVNVKESARVFSKGLLKVFDENKSVVDSFKSFFIIKEKLNTIILIDKTLEEINERKLFLDRRIKESEDENKVLNEELEKIKKSQSYLDFLNNQKKVEYLKLESKENILELKQLLDFKALANFFHIFEKEMRIVKIHKEDFYTHFMKDNGQTIMELLDKAKLNNKIILEKVNLIKTKIGEISNYEKEIKENETQKESLEIEEINSKLNNLKIEKIKGEKREEKLKVNRGKLREILKEKIRLVGGELKDDN